MDGQANGRAVAGTEHLVGLLADWSERGHGGLARRLAGALRTAIRGGVLATGTVLPAERRLAQLLSVSRSTVTAALDELRAEGLVRSRQGSGTEVIGVAGPATGAHRVGSHFVRAGSGIDLAAVVPTEGGHLPPIGLRTEDLLAAHGHLEPNGLTSLRTALADRHTAAGRFTEAEQIQVTHGAHHAIALTLLACASPGAAVAIEHPSYPGILDLIDHQRLRPIELDADAGGPVAAALDRTLAEARPAAVYLQTGVHNPTGRVIGEARRRALAEVLDAHPATVVIEDNTLADLVFAGRPTIGFADLCRHAPVVTIESLSKVAWAALRIGWLRASGATGGRIAQVRNATDLGASIPSQLLALQLLPSLDAMADQRRRTLETAVAHAVGRLRNELPDWRIEAPEGSSALYPELPVPDATTFVALARRHGVHVTPGSAHSPTSAPDPHLRLCVDRPVAHVDEGIGRLVAAWHEARAHSPVR